jgi:tRNA 2-thiouridine synthesizing protein B
MLHTINKSPLSSTTLQSCLRVAAKGDPILLLEEGVYAAKTGASSQPLVAQALVDHPVYALGPDLAARAVVKVLEGVRVIDYQGFVDLVERHGVVPWL